jgi:phage regulator Rha-like protein
MKANTALKLVEIHGQKLTTTSLVIAELFGRPHGKVLKKLEELSSKDRIEFSSMLYKDSYGRDQKLLVLDERSFLIAMPFIGGNKSEEGQVKLVDEFLRLQKLFREPNRKEELQLKRDTWLPLTDMMKFTRETLGKESTEKHHYENEAKFCNRALTGVYGPLDEAALDAHDARKLAAIRAYDTMLMTRYIVQKDRRRLMDAFVVAYDLKHPRLKLVCDNQKESKP